MVGGSFHHSFRCGAQNSQLSDPSVSIYYISQTTPRGGYRNIIDDDNWRLLAPRLQMGWGGGGEQNLVEVHLAPLADMVL